MSSSDPSPSVDRIHWTPELVERFWNGVAQTRLDDLSFGKVAGPQFLDLVERFLEPDGRHLDFGAGSGHVVKLLLERGYEAAGFDPAPERQDRLTRTIGLHERFLGAEGAESANRYDVVLMMEVIEHILEPDVDTTLQRVADFVRPGGVLIVSTPNNEDLDQSSVFCPVSATLYHPWQHVRSLTPASLSETLAGFGFEKELLILADFSNDAKLIEDFKQFKATESRKAGLIERSAQLTQEFSSAARDHAILVARLSQEMATAQEGGLLRRMFRRFGSSRLQGRTVLEVEQLLSQAQTDFRCTADAAAALSNEFLALDRALPAAEDGIAEDHQGINRRIGKETTIVYVGRKIRDRDSQVGASSTAAVTRERNPYV
jgi:2-polyprenyl-3-methyl-5-hydroxy-6-metoxy-1,4-benzoquinol methylase